MPIYECLTVEGTLDDGKRRRLAEAFTAIHAEETDAPADLINVVFPELPQGHSYTAARQSAPALIRGQVRAGRGPEVRLALMRRINDAYVDITGGDPIHVLVAILDVPAKWVMEAGQVLPEPDKDEEAAWFAELRSRTGRDGLV